MSSFIPHFTTGIICGAIGTCSLFGFNCPIDHVSYYILPMLSGISGALTPDMDIKSKSSQCMYILYAGLALYLYYIGRIDLAFFTLLYSIVPQFFSHRGFIHSCIFGLLSTIGLYFICNSTTGNLIFSTIFSLSYFIGFLSHIALDNA